MNAHSCFWFIEVDVSNEQVQLERDSMSRSAEQAGGIVKELWSTTPFI